METKTQESMENILLQHKQDLIDGANATLAEELKHGGTQLFKDPKNAIYAVLTRPDIRSSDNIHYIMGGIFNKLESFEEYIFSLSRSGKVSEAESYKLAMNCFIASYIAGDIKNVKSSLEGLVKIMDICRN